MAEKLLTDRFPYYLPLTRLRIHGKQTTKTPVAGQATVMSEVAVDLVTSADPEHPRYVDEADSFLADSKLTIEVSDQGVLHSTNASSSGKLGNIVTNIFGTILRFSLFFGGGIAALRAEGTKKAIINTVDAEYEKEFPDLAAARKAAKAAVAALLKSIAEKSRALIELTGDALKDARQAIATLTDALAALKKEAEALEAHFNAWKAGKEQPVVTERDHIVEIVDLPAEKDVLLLKGKSPEEIKGALPPKLRDLFWDLRIIVADSKLSEDPTGKLPKLKDDPMKDRKDAKGIEFRAPRPTTIGFFEVHETSPGTGSFDAVAKERRSIAVLDSLCTPVFFSAKSSAWADKSLEIEFAATGGARKIGTNHKSELEAISNALSKLPAETLKAMQDANAFVDERQKLALQSIEQRIEQLKKQKEETQARIALNETLATEAQAAELKRIEQDIALLQKQMQLDQLAGTADATLNVKLLEIEEDLVAARTALEAAEIERLRVEAELKKAKEPPPS